jgi:uncharacterized membrane protein YgcG
MSVLRGTVLKITDQTVVVVGEDGRFHNLPPHWLGADIGVGDEVSWTAPAAVNPKRARIPWKRIGGIVAASLLMAFAGQAMWWKTTSAAAMMVAIDINPSLDVYANARGEVIRVVPLNDDAVSLLQGFSFNRLTLPEVMHLLLERAAELHFLKPDTDNLVMATIVPYSSRAAQVAALKQQLATSAQGISDPLTLIINTSDPQTEQEAAKEHLSVNQYIVRNRLIHQGMNVPPSEWQSQPIDSILDQSKIPVQSLFPDILEVRPNAPSVPAGTESPSRGKPSGGGGHGGQPSSRNGNDENGFHGNRNDSGTGGDPQSKDNGSPEKHTDGAEGTNGQGDLPPGGETRQNHHADPGNGKPTGSPPGDHSGKDEQENSND